MNFYIVVFRNYIIDNGIVFVCIICYYLEILILYMKNQLIKSIYVNIIERDFFLKYYDLIVFLIICF